VYDEDLQNPNKTTFYGAFTLDGLRELFTTFNDPSYLSVATFTVNTMVKEEFVGLNYLGDFEKVRNNYCKNTPSYRINSRMIIKKFLEHELNSK
jgi:hypothetical protein